MLQRFPNVFIVFALLTSCSDNNSKNAQPVSYTVTPESLVAPNSAENGSALLTGTDLVISGIPVPPPPSDTSNASLIGIDTNSNGVRDDAERLIVMAYGKDTQQLAGTMQLSRRIQSILTPDAMDTTTVQAQVNMAAEEAQCLAEKNFGGDFAAAERANQVVQGAMLNTQERIKRYQERVSVASAVVSIDFKRECK